MDRKTRRAGGGSTGRLLIGDLARGDELQVGDQLPYRAARLARIPPQLALELHPPPIPQRATPKLQVSALHLATPVEQPVDLGERQQPHALRGEVVGDGEQPREERRVV